MSKIVVTVLLATILCALVNAQETPCTFKLYSNVHLNWDLSALTKTSGYYKVHDYLNEYTSNRTIAFNFCKDITDPPKDRVGGESCKSTLHTTNPDEYIDTPVPFFLVNEEGNKDTQLCRRISGPDSKRTGGEPYDYYDYSKGICYYTYGGDKIDSYETRVKMCVKCAARNTISNRAIVSASYGTFSITVNNIWGCPLECHPTEKGGICSGHGVCLYDSDKYTASCRCSTGFKGATCSETVGISMTQIFLYIDLAVVAVIVITIIYMGLKLRKIRLNPDAAQDSETKFNQLGAMSF